MLKTTAICSFEQQNWARYNDTDSTAVCLGHDYLFIFIFDYL